VEERDVIVIGAGSAGEVLASRLASAGMSVVVVEDRLVGGQCPFWACMPAKALLRPGQVVAEAAGVPGVSEPEVRAQQVFTWRNAVSDHWNDHGHVDELESDGVEVIRGRGRIIGERSIEIEMEGDAPSLTIRASRAVVIGTGSRPASLPIEGAADIDVWSSEQVTTAVEAPGRMLIVGGGAVGLESAQAYWSLGSEVIVVESEDRLLSREDPFVGEFLADEFARRGIRVVTGATVDRLAPSTLGAVATLSSGQRVEVDQVVSAIGRVPNRTAIGLDLIGLEGEGPILVDDSMRVRGHESWLFAIGDVNGRSMFTHAAKQHARVAAAVIAGSTASVARSERAIPRCVFTEPVVASTGSTAAEARAVTAEAVVTSADLGMLAEAGIWGETVRGRAQAVWIDHRLVGATMVGPGPVIELIASFQMAILAGMSVSALRDFVPQFPSFSEVWLDLLPG
jgi:pyruvate/2-oxoglutarate dehydrogenase complex dihydrolipoamide dehydrogenase (E3) component